VRTDIAIRVDQLPGQFVAVPDQHLVYQIKDGV